VVGQVAYGAPGLKVMVTSRVSLHIKGERSSRGAPAPSRHAAVAPVEEDPVVMKGGPVISQRGQGRS